MSLKLNSIGGGSLLLQEPNTASARTISLPDGDGSVPLMLRGSAVATTSGTSIDFTSIPTWVKKITVVLSGVSTSSTSVLLLRLGSGGAVATTGYLGSGVSLFAGAMPSISNFTNGFGIGQISDAAFVRHGIITLTNIASNTWVCSGYIGQSDNARGNAVGGSVTLAGVLDRVRLTTVNGTDTFDAGSVNLIYEGY